MTKVFWVGIQNDKKITNKLYCQDITELYHSGVDEIGNEETVINDICGRLFKGYISFIIQDAKDQQEAVDTVVKQYFTQSHIKLV
jgi:hypothetical protein